MSLGTARPYRVDGTIRLENELARANASVMLSGDLNRLNVTGNLDGYDAKG